MERLTLDLSLIANLLDAAEHAEEMLNAILDRQPAAESARYLAIDLNDINDDPFMELFDEYGERRQNLSDVAARIRRTKWTRIELDPTECPNLTLYADELKDQ